MVKSKPLLLFKTILGIIIFLTTATISVYYYFVPPPGITELLPGLLYTSATIIVFVLFRRTAPIINFLLYYFLMIVTYYAIWIITIYTSYFAFILGIVTAGIGAWITFILTEKLITKTPFNRRNVFIIGGLSFLVTDIVRFSYSDDSKSIVDYIFNIAPSTDAIYGEVIFFWQLFVGIKLVLILRKGSDNVVNESEQNITDNQQTKPSVTQEVPGEHIPKSIAAILGDKITDIKMYYEPQGENDWLDTVLTYIFLENNGIINFPFSGDTEFINVAFDTRAKPINEKAIPNIIGQTIIDIYYTYDEAGEPDFEWVALIQLSNGFVINENRMAPHGTGAANLFLYTSEQFKKKFENGENDIRSVRQMVEDK